MPRNRRQPRKGGTSTVSRKTLALRGSTGLTEGQEEHANALLRKLALALHGEAWASKLTDDERADLCRKVASTMRKGGLPATTVQVRMVAQRMRSTPEVRTGYPVDLDPDLYAFIAREHATKGGTMKAIASAIIRAHVDQQEA
jgi:hypothetical protein